MVAGWKGLPVVAALVLVGAVSFTLVAAYQWAGRLGIFGEAATLAAGNWQSHVWQGHVWNTVLAIILWRVWFMANNNTRNVGT
jgi:hypothetical protein